MTIESAAPAKQASFNWRLYVPKSITVIAQEGYRFADFRADALAGLTVAIVALPLAMAIAIASGTTPDKGLITAVIAGFLISALGGSRFQIGGPTGAFIVVVYGVIQQVLIMMLSLCCHRFCLVFVNSSFWMFWRCID